MVLLVPGSYRGLVEGGLDDPVVEDALLTLLTHVTTNLYTMIQFKR